MLWTRFHPMPAASRRRLGIDIAAGLYAAVFFVWLALRTAGIPSAQTLSTLAFCPLGLAVAWANWRVSRLPGLDTRTRAAWCLLSVSALLLLASGSAWGLYLQLSGGRDWPAWIDDLELGHSLAVLAAILVLPRGRFQGRNRTRLLFDGVLTAVAAFVLALSFVLRLWSKGLYEASSAEAVIGPAADWAVFVAAALGSTQKRDHGTRLALAWLAIGTTLYLVANYSLTAGGFTYRPGDAVDGLWFAAWLCRWGAARLAIRRYDRDRRPPTARETGWAVYEGSGLSYLVAASVCIALTSQVFTAEPPFLGVLAFSLALVVGLLLARQMIELREHRRLFDERFLQESRFRSLVQQSSDAVLVVDGSGVISYASPSAPRVFGDAASIQPGVSLLDLAREDDRPGLAAMLSGARGAGRLQLHLPGTAGWRDVEALWSDLRSDPPVGGIVVNCRDVTERNELERRLRHSQKLDAVGHLAGGLAHDLNNALAIMRGYGDLLDGAVAPGSAAEDDLEHVQQAVERAATITGKLLAFSRRQPVLRVVLDMNALIDGLLPLLRQAVAPNVEVVFRPGAGLWAVCADRGQMEQVLLNLATNARDAMPGGGVLEISTEKVSARSVPRQVPGGPPGDCVSIIARDTGTGMSPEVRGRVFEPFFSTKGPTAGMGLGLAMVHGIVADSGGLVFVESVVGRGSAFTVLLPRSDAALATEEPQGDAGEREAGVRTVLLVDDEEQVRSVARRILEQRGYRVIDVADGEAALEILGRPSVCVDVLVTDLVMPGMNGRQLIARLAGLRPALPVVCVTGFADDGDDPSQYGPNLVALLVKPFTADRLVRAVREAIAKGEAAC